MGFGTDESVLFMEVQQFDDIRRWVPNVRTYVSCECIENTSINKTP